jgi:3-dehydroquinate synthase
VRTLQCAPEGAVRTAVTIGSGVARLAEVAARPGAFVLADAALLRASPAAAQAIASAPKLVLEGGEGCKSFSVLEGVLRHLARLQLDRRACLVALGGGTIGDLGGLAAGLYLRGIDLVAVPTTLVAMLDSAVGGKAAVNLPEGKNLAGMIWPAREVRIDPDFLRSLPAPQLASGLGEALKVAIGLDPELFALLDRRRAEVQARDLGVLEQVIWLAVRAKVAVVEQDLTDTGARRLLNLGHSLGHALEAHSGWRLPHGVAVARGLHFALEVAQRRAAIDAAAAARCRSLLEAYGFAATPLPPGAELREFLARDKKAEGGGLHFVLPTGVGSSRTELLALDQLLELL